MPQLSLRLDAELVARVKAHASASGRSVNSWIVALLSAAVDPELAGNEAERTRERLARAGLLAPPAGRTVVPPDRERVRQARHAAGSGVPLSQLVSENRG